MMAAAWQRAGNALLYVDGKKVGEGRVETTVPMLFSADETCDVGRGTGSAVSLTTTRETMNLAAR